MAINAADLPDGRDEHKAYVERASQPCLAPAEAASPVTRTTRMPLPICDRLAESAVARRLNRPVRGRHAGW